MNHDSSDSQAPCRTQTKTPLPEPLDEGSGKDPSWCDGDYSPTPGECRLLAWLAHVAELPGKATVRMALLVQHSATKYGRKQHLMVTPKKITEAGMSRVAAYEGLRALESAGLVTVKRCRGRSPLVTIVDQQDTGE